MYAIICDKCRKGIIDKETFYQVYKRTKGVSKSYKAKTYCDKCFVDD